jgi:GNAT superfamily N-acetyltransferase
MIIRTHPADPAFRSLIEELDRELWETYPTLQGSYAELNTLSDGVLVAVLVQEGKPIACGCLRPYAEAAYELKRMFVRKECRGRGFSKIILSELEKWAKETGGRDLLLETGVKQVAAISLYENNGYLRIGNYGEYKGNANSVCMKKKI